MKKLIALTLVLILTNSVCLGQVEYPDFSQAEVGLEIGNIAPEINLPDKDGNMVSLSSLRGKVVLISFWAAWAGPCIKRNT